MRNAILILLGLAAGVAGTVLFRDSMVPAAGTPEARILTLENELRETRLRLAKIDPDQARPHADMRSALTAGARAALDDLKAGRPVDVNHLYEALKPMLRELSPIFDRMRQKEERRQFDRVAGEMTRKYNLDPTQQEALKQWMKGRADLNAELFKAVALADGTRLEDLVKATKDIRPDDGLDGFMEGQLKGETLETFRQDRLTERAGRVQNEADARVARLNNIVQLDEAQQDQVFSIMARSSRDFDPRMQLEGVSSDATAADGDRQAAIMAVLRPEQQASYDQWIAERTARKTEEMTDLGLKMPESWQALDEDW